MAADPAGRAADPPVRRIRLTGPQRYAQLVEAARGVFVRNGLAGTRTKQIADAAGVSEAMIYHHFSSKEEIFEAAVLEPLERAVRELASAGNRFSRVEGATRRDESYRVNARTMESMVEIAPLLGVALFSDYEFGLRFYRDRLAPLFTQVVASVESGLSGWQHGEADPRLIAAVMLGTYNWLAIEENFGESRTDVGASAKALTDLLIRSIAAPRPQPGAPDQAPAT